MGPFKFKPTTGIFFAILPCKPLILITMKKTDLIKFQTILFTATILIILSSCASSYTSSRNYNTKTLEIQVLKPASIGVPEGVYRYGIINQIAKSKNDPIEISKTEQETLHDNTRKSCLNGLYKYINESEAIDTAQVLNANRKFFTDTSQMFWPNIEKFCSQHNIDAIVYIDRLKIDNSTTRSSNYPVNDKYAELKLKTTWIVLFPGERKKIEKDIDYNKYGKVNDGKDKFIYNAGYMTGAKFGKHIIPGWTKTERKFFVANDEDFKKATEFFQNSQWEDAAKIWSGYLSSENKNLAAKANFNLALYYEIQGSLDQAFELAKKADQVYNLPLSHEYAGNLYRRIKDQYKLAEQMKN